MKYALTLGVLAAAWSWAEPAAAQNRYYSRYSYGNSRYSNYGYRPSYHLGSRYQFGSYTYNLTGISPRGVYSNYYAPSYRYYSPSYNVRYRSRGYSNYGRGRTIYRESYRNRGGYSRSRRSYRYHR